MTLNDLAQVGIGALGSGGGAWAFVKAYLALKPHLKNSQPNGLNMQILDHLDKQNTSLQSIATDIHVSTERLGEFIHETREYQQAGRLAMQRVTDLWEQQK